MRRSVALATADTFYLAGLGTIADAAFPTVTAHDHGHAAGQVSADQVALRTARVS